jgi:uncharacterized protein (TIGR03435 family)
MRKTATSIALAVAFAAASRAQAPLMFEAASVHTAARQAPRRGIAAGGEIEGGPGTDDPERISYEWCPMSTIIQNLFGVNFDRILNRPDWLGMDRFDIVAKVPPGATKDKVNEMMVNLLKERFHFAYHLEQRDFDAYDLVVAKGGPNLKEARRPGVPRRRLRRLALPLLRRSWTKTAFRNCLRAGPRYAESPATASFA